MMKLQGIVSEIPAVQVPVAAPQVEEKKNVVVFKETFVASNAMYIPTVKRVPQPDGMKQRRKRLILGVAISAFLLGAAALGILSLVGDKKDKVQDKIKWIVVSVDKGDTVWDLVKQSNPNADMQELVYLAQERNKLKGKPLQVGMTIEIPVKEVK